jgi:bifunctional non-homologous end joining protein LigD
LAHAKLARYQEKRDLMKTVELSGNDKVVPSEALRFAIQKLAATHLHFDLRLEYDGTFRQYRMGRRSIRMIGA